jgi:hypothetical protein
LAPWPPALLLAQINVVAVCDESCFAASGLSNAYTYIPAIAYDVATGKTGTGVPSKTAGNKGVTALIVIMVRLLNS